MLLDRAVVLLCAVLLALSSAGCEKTDHENIDRWMKTQKGPDKLKKAVRDVSIDPDLSAHAAENLLKAGQDGEVRGALEALPPDRRAVVTARLAPRLWNLA